MALVKNPTNNFGFVGGKNTSDATIGKKPKDHSVFGAPTLISTRRTWSERSGYNTQEVYVGDRAQLDLAFDDPRFVCGAQQVVLDEDENTRRTTLTIDFSHRTRRAAQANYSQPEEFRDVWTLESQVENAEIWRHPRYSRLDSIEYKANNQYPLSRLIVLVAQQYEQVFLQAANTQIQEFATDLSGTTPVTGFAGVANLTRPFDVWDYIRNPPADQDVLDLGRCLANNVLKGKTTLPIFRQVVSNQAVVPNNSGWGNVFGWKDGYITTRQLTWIILQNIYGLEYARSHTPAGCRPVSASKWALIRGLLGKFDGNAWMPYAPSVVELTNGSFEVTRSFVEQFAWEVDDCAFTPNPSVNNDTNPVIDNNGGAGVGPVVTGPPSG